MKEIIIKVRVEEKELKTLIQKSGFNDDLSDSLLLIGIYENLKMLEQEKLKQSQRQKVKI